MQPERSDAAERKPMRPAVYSNSGHAITVERASTGIRTYDDRIVLVIGHETAGGAPGSETRIVLTGQQANQVSGALNDAIFAQLRDSLPRRPLIVTLLARSVPIWRPAGRPGEKRHD